MQQWFVYQFVSQCVASFTVFRAKYQVPMSIEHLAWFTLILD